MIGLGSDRPRLRCQSPTGSRRPSPQWGAATRTCGPGGAAVDAQDILGVGSLSAGRCTGGCMWSCRARRATSAKEHRTSAPCATMTTGCPRRSQRERRDLGQGQADRVRDYDVEGSWHTKQQISMGPRRRQVGHRDGRRSTSDDAGDSRGQREQLAARAW